jgi:hypothetical protein
MICARCAKAADRGDGRAAHCDDETCPCQHRPAAGPRRYSVAIHFNPRRVVADVLLPGVS